MNWLLRFTNQSIVHRSEALVDCQSCTVRSPLVRDSKYSVETKCCDFSPFISCFALGAWIFEGHSLNQLRIEEFILSCFGILHPMKHRLDKTAQCLNFDFEKGGSCKIWSQRPATCFNFYCAASIPLKEYQKQEERQLQVEAQLLHLWASEQGVTQIDWKLWSEYMEEVPLVQELPTALTMQSTEKAEGLYMESYKWLKANFSKLQRELAPDLESC